MILRKKCKKNTKFAAEIAGQHTKSWFSRSFLDFSIEIFGKWCQIASSGSQEHFELRFGFSKNILQNGTKSYSKIIWLWHVRPKKWTQKSIFLNQLTRKTRKTITKAIRSELKLLALLKTSMVGKLLSEIMKKSDFLSFRWVQK